MTLNYFWAFSRKAYGGDFTCLTPLLAPDAPMAEEIENDSQGVINLAQEIGLGTDIDLVACKKYGEVDRTLDPGKGGKFS